MSQGAEMWHSLVGEIQQYTGPVGSGASGTITIGPGEVILVVLAHASAANATVNILGNGNIPIVNQASAPPTVIQQYHTLLQSNMAQNTVVFTNTDVAYVQTVKIGHA